MIGDNPLGVRIRKTKYIFLTALTGIIANRSRSSLTVLGIVIGISAIILIESLGAGTQALILKQVQALGSDTIIVRPGRMPKGPTDVGDTMLSDSLKLRDLEALKKKSNVPDVVSISALVMVPGGASAGSAVYRAAVMGWDTEFMGKMMDIYPAEGYFFGENEIREKAQVVVIGDKVQANLFPNESAIGKSIMLKGKKFRVIGVFPQKGQSSFLNIDDLAIVPYSTAQSYLLGTNHFNEMMVKVGSGDNVARSVEDIKLTLRTLHGITDPEKDDFYVETQQGVVEQIKTILDVLTLFLSAVVAISLVVGGIGVMNIMLVSVTERTREIGLRKALGATEKDILLQFLFGAILLTGIGGLLGVAFGMLFSLIASLLLTYVVHLDWTFSFSIYSMVLGVGVSAIVGLVFGLYPAKKAADKNPIEALRYE
jgi:putative ABC transport system permease protein